MSTGPSFSLELQPSTKVVDTVKYIRGVIALTDTNYTSFTNAGFSYFLVALTEEIDTNSNDTNNLGTLLYNTTFQATDKSNITFDLPYIYSDNTTYTVAVTAFYDTTADPRRVAINHTYLPAPSSIEYKLLVGSAVDVNDTNDPKQGKLLATISLSDDATTTAESTTEYLVQAYTSDHTQFYNDTVLVNRDTNNNVNLLENLIEGGTFLENQYWYITVTAITGGGSIVLYGDAENNQTDVFDNNAFTPVKISNEPNPMILTFSELDVQKVQLTAEDVLPNDDYDITKLVVSLTVSPADTSEASILTELTYTGTNLSALRDTSDPNNYILTFPDNIKYSNENCGDDDSKTISLPQEAKIRATIAVTHTFNDSNSDTSLDSYQYTKTMNAADYTVPSYLLTAESIVVALQGYDTNNIRPKLELTATYPDQDDTNSPSRDITELKLTLTKNSVEKTWTFNVSDTNVTQEKDSNNDDTFTLVVESDEPVTGATDSTTTMTLAGGDEISISLVAVNLYGEGEAKTQFIYNNNSVTSVTIQEPAEYNITTNETTLRAAITDSELVEDDYTIKVTFNSNNIGNTISEILNLNGITKYKLDVLLYESGQPGEIATRQTVYDTTDNDTTNHIDKLGEVISFELDTNESKPAAVKIELVVTSTFDDGAEVTNRKMSNEKSVTLTILSIVSTSLTLVQPERGESQIIVYFATDKPTANDTEYESGVVELLLYPNNDINVNPNDLINLAADTSSELYVAPSTTIVEETQDTNIVIDSTYNYYKATISIDTNVLPKLFGSRLTARAKILTLGGSGGDYESEWAKNAASKVYLYDKPILSWTAGTTTAEVTPNGYVVSTVFAVDGDDDTESLTVIAGGQDSTYANNLVNNNPYNTSFEGESIDTNPNVIRIENIAATDDHLLIVLKTVHGDITGINENHLLVSEGVTLN